MQRQQEIATDRLVSIIQTIQLRRGTGVLRARRGEGITSEEGTITFANGKVAEARVGRRTGSDALNFLSTWGSCLFTYHTSNPQESMWFVQSVPPAMPQTNFQQRETFTPVSPMRRPSGFQGMEERGITDPALFSNPTPPGAIPGQGSAAPYHTRQLASALQIIDNLSLSRTYRQVFLLIDGQRTILELMRLTGRGYDELASILHELERATVIRIPN